MRSVLSASTRAGMFHMLLLAAIALVGIVYPSESDAQMCDGAAGENCDPSSRHPLDWLRVDDGMGHWKDYTNVDSAGLSNALLIGCADYAAIHSDPSPASGHTYRFATCIPALPLPLPSTGGQSGSIPINGTLIGTQNWDGNVFYNSTGQWNLGTGGCTDSLGHTAATGTDGQCYCKYASQRWSASQHSCVPWRDRWHPKEICQPSGGNPIYPLTGSKRQSEELGTWLAQRVGLLYDTRIKVPSSNSNDVFSEVPAPSFGGLWKSTLHKKLSFQGIASNQHAVQASRGAGVWVSFTRDTMGNYNADADIKDRLIPAGAGWRYFDAANQAQETYDSQGVLSNVSFVRGGNLTYIYSDANTPANIAPAAGLLIKVQDHNGRSVQFQYEQPPGVSTPRIKSVLDPAAQSIGVFYDAAGNVGQLLWPDSQLRKFLYETADLPWALTGITDENNKRYATYGYDAQGRAVSTEFTGGVNRYSLSYTTPPQWNIVENYDAATGILWRDHYWQLPERPVMMQPTGSAVSFTAALILGMPRVTSQSQAAGSGCGASTSVASYDANGNVTSADDFNGSRACYVSDPSRNLEATRVEGLANTVACSSVTSTNATLPAGSRKASTSWHPDWPLQAKVAGPGKLTTNVYNGQPDPYSGNAIASCAPATAQMPDGKPIAMLCKQVEQATKDAGGSLGFDLNGVPAVQGDPNYAKDVLLLHMDGANGATVFSDTSSQVRTPSNVIAPLVTDATSAKYGSAAANFTGGYLWYADSPDWDMAAGDFTIETWAKFDATAAGSRAFLFGKSGSNGSDNTITIGKGSDDKLAVYWTTTGGSSSFTDSVAVSPNTWYHVAVVRSGSTLTLWKNGASAGSVGVSGSFIANSNHFAVGALGEYTAYYGGSYGTKMIGWFDEFRVTKGLARYIAAFTPPATAFANSTTSTSAVPSSMDASVPARTRSYTYNQHGQMLTEKDALNNTTAYAYYSDTTVDHTLGDLQSVTNAVGKVTQYPQYNKYGQALRMVDVNSVITDYTYDLRQRVKSVSVAGQTTSYDYDAVGQLIKVTQPDASYVRYAYDDAHRMVAVFDNLNNRIEYTLDNAGNRIAESVKDPANVLARQVTRVMDALGRVQQTTGTQ